MNAALLTVMLMAGQTNRYEAATNLGAAANVRPPELDGAGVTQKLGTQLPADLILHDESGADVALGKFFHDRPVVLVLAYFKCPMLCTEVLNGLFETLPRTGLNPDQYELVVVSFDPREGPEMASEKRKHYLEAFARPGLSDHVHFLTGGKPSIDALTQAVGFTFKYDAKSNQFAHPGMVTFLTPEGKIARYFFGVRFQPRDLRLGLVEAADGKIGTLSDQVILFCLYYDPNGANYALKIVRIGGIITLALMAGFIGMALRRERKRSALRLSAAQPEGVLAHSDASPAIPHGEAGEKT